MTKRLPLSKRKFKVFLEHEDGSTTEFNLDGDSPFSQATSGEKRFKSGDMSSTLVIRWTLPEKEQQPDRRRTCSRRKNLQDLNIHSLRKRFEEATALLVHDSTGCSFLPDSSTYYQTDSNGVQYARLTVGNDHVRFTHAALFLQRGETTQGFAKTEQIPLYSVDVSHLCHNSRCCSTDHLCLEHHSNNIKRNRCSKEGRCLGPQQHTGVPCLL